MKAVIRTMDSGGDKAGKEALRNLLGQKLVNYEGSLPVDDGYINELFVSEFRTEKDLANVQHGDLQSLDLPPGFIERLVDAFATTGTPESRAWLA